MPWKSRPEAGAVSETLCAVDELNPASVRLAAMDLLARREHLRAELEHKLLRRFGREADVVVGAVLDDLTAERLLSEARFVDAYLAQRARRGYGPGRIRQELRQKGAPAELVAQCFEAAEQDWALLAREVRAKKFGAHEPADYRDKGKQLRFLHYRGFGDYANHALSLED